MTNQEIASLDGELSDEDLQALADHMLSEEAALPTESNRALARGVLRLLRKTAPSIDNTILRAETQTSIVQWANATFGTTAPMRVATRANEEMAELLKAVCQGDVSKAAEEVADVVIVLYRAATLLGVDLHAEIDRKMQINRARRWNVGPDGHGYHVKDAA